MELTIRIALLRDTNQPLMKLRKVPGRHAIETECI